MVWFKRIGLFILTNILIMFTISIMMSVFGLNGYINKSGLNLSSLMAICLIWGMAGSLISLFMSKAMAKWMMGVQIIDPKTAGTYSDLVQSIKRISASANIHMPEVGVYESPEINAFATGPTKSNALVAVSTGLLERMSRNEIEGVLAHEVSHIANGDMVTMTLIQGLVNSFALFLSRIISFAVGQMVKEELEVIVRFVTTIVLDIVFTILGSIVVAYFSRQREFKADLGGAKLAGRSNMIAALENLQRSFEPVDDRGTAYASLKISGGKSWLSLFSTHPPLEDRIAALKSAKV